MKTFQTKTQLVLSLFLLFFATPAHAIEWLPGTMDRPVEPDTHGGDASDDGNRQSNSKEKAGSTCTNASTPCRNDAARIDLSREESLQHLLDWFFAHLFHWT